MPMHNWACIGLKLDALWERTSTVGKTIFWFKLSIKTENNPQLCPLGTSLFFQISEKENPSHSLGPLSILMAVAALKLDRITLYNLCFCFTQKIIFVSFESLCEPLFSTLRIRGPSPKPPVMCLVGQGRGLYGSGQAKPGERHQLC